MALTESHFDNCSAAFVAGPNSRSAASSRIVLLIDQSWKSFKCLVASRGLPQRVSDATVSQYRRVDVADNPSAFLHPLREGPVLALADAFGIRVKGAEAIPGRPGHEHRVASNGIGFLYAPSVNQPLVRLVVRVALATEQMATGPTSNLDHVSQPPLEHCHIVIEEAQPIAATEYFLGNLCPDIAKEAENAN